MNQEQFKAFWTQLKAPLRAKWEKITYAGIVTCTLLAAYNLSKGHPHFDEQPVRSCS